MTPKVFLDGRVNLWAADCLEVLKLLPENSVDSVVTDPPYHLTSIVKRFGADNAAACKEGKTGAYARASKGFMGKTWDGGDIAFRSELWAEALRVLKPGGHLLAFSATRTYHRMACAIEDAGFEVRDMASWMYGSGFPKSHDVAKGISAKQTHGTARTEDIRRLTMGDDYVPSGRGRVNYDYGGGSAMNGGGAAPLTEKAKQWEGWGTALKPAQEPICLARKPLDGTVAANILKWGVGALNIDGCRVGTEGGGTHCPNRDETGKCLGHPDRRGTAFGMTYHGAEADAATGRWPANVLTDGSDEVIAAFPETSPGSVSRRDPNGAMGYHGGAFGQPDVVRGHADAGGSAARFFYSAKADADDRLGSGHPTVKPVDLMQYLVRLITPKGGTVLDCFAGTGTTGEAAFREGMNAILIEREEQYHEDIERRMGLCLAGPVERRVSSIKARNKPQPVTDDLLSGFGDAA